MSAVPKIDSEDISLDDVYSKFYLVPQRGLEHA